MREYTEWMLHKYPNNRMECRVNKEEKGMLGIIYQRIAEMASRINRFSSQRPHKGLPNKENMIVTSYSRSPSGLHATRTAPSACLRSFIDRIEYAKRYGRKLASVLRRKKRNGN